MDRGDHNVPSFPFARVSHYSHLLRCRDRSRSRPPPAGRPESASSRRPRTPVSAHWRTFFQVLLRDWALGLYVCLTTRPPARHTRLLLLPIARAELVRHLLIYRRDIDVATLGRLGRSDGRALEGRSPETIWYMLRRIRPVDDDVVE